MTATPATLARELATIITADVRPQPDAAALAALQAGLRRQVAAVGPTIAEAAVRRLAAAPGPACIHMRRAKFGGIAAALSSAPLSTGHDRGGAGMMAPGIDGVEARPLNPVEEGCR